MKLKEIQNSGYDVVIRHYRPLMGDKKLYRVSSIRELGLTGAMSTHGGETVVYVSRRDYNPVWKKGVARCNSGDRFCYKTGVELALAKAFQEESK